MSIQGDEISFFTGDFKVCPRIFFRFLRFVPDDSISHYHLFFLEDFSSTPAQ